MASHLDDMGLPVLNGNVKVRNHDRRLGCDQDGHQSNMDRINEDQIEPIAVVGLASRFPGDAASSDLFWKMMIKKQCASKAYPANRMNIDAFYHPDPNKLNKVRMYFLVAYLLYETSNQIDIYQRGAFH